MKKRTACAQAVLFGRRLEKKLNAQLEEERTRAFLASLPPASPAKAGSGKAITDAAIISAFAERGITAVPRHDTLTLKQWNALSRKIRKGQHGVRVTVPGAFAYTVFHFSQTEDASPEELEEVKARQKRRREKAREAAEMFAVERAERAAALAEEIAAIDELRAEQAAVRDEASAPAPEYHGELVPF